MVTMATVSPVMREFLLLGPKGGPPNALTTGADGRFLRCEPGTYHLRALQRRFPKHLYACVGA